MMSAYRYIKGKAMISKDIERLAEQLLLNKDQTEDLKNWFEENHIEKMIVFKLTEIEIQNDDEYRKVMMEARDCCYDEMANQLKVNSIGKFECSRDSLAKTVEGSLRVVFRKR